jgi:hypothetical protein
VSTFFQRVDTYSTVHSYGSLRLVDDGRMRFVFPIHASLGKNPGPQEQKIEKEREERSNEQTIFVLVTAPGLLLPVGLNGRAPI